MTKPLSRAELTELTSGLEEVEDTLELRETITKLVKSHRSLWTATEGLVNHIQRDQESREVRRKAST